MNIVDDDTSNKEPESIGSPAARQGVSSPGESSLSGFFSSPATVTRRTGRGTRRTGAGSIQTMQGVSV